MKTKTLLVAKNAMTEVLKSYLMVETTALVAAIYASGSQKQKETKMEPKDPNKKYEDILKNINFSFMVPATVPVGTYKFNQPIETLNETIARLDEVDETVDAMTTYPQAKKMLDKVFDMR
jgi:hypothetical protein